MGRNQILAGALAALRINFSKSGPNLGFGGLVSGPRRARASVGVPGTDAYWEEQSRQTARRANSNRWIWIVTALPLATCTAAHAADYSSWNNRDLVKLYKFWDLLCRGLDDEDVIDEGCKDRNELVKVLLARGYCYVGYDYQSTRWKKGPASRWRKRAEEARCR